jgi:hypothetical protein
MTTEAGHEAPYIVGWGIRHRSNEDYRSALLKYGSILGDPDVTDSLPLPTIIDHETEFMMAVSGLLSRKLALVLTTKSANEAHESNAIEITTVRESMGQEPKAEDREGNTIPLSDLCRIIAKGAEITLVEQS